MADIIGHPERWARPRQAFWCFFSLFHDSLWYLITSDHQEYSVYPYVEEFHSLWHQANACDLTLSVISGLPWSHWYCNSPTTWCLEAIHPYLYLCRHMASLGHSEITTVVSCWIKCFVAKQWTYRAYVCYEVDIFIALTTGVLLKVHVLNISWEFCSRLYIRQSFPLGI